MMEQNIALPDRCENILLCCIWIQDRRKHRQEWRIFQLGAIECVNVLQITERKASANTINIDRFDLEIAHENFKQRLGHAQIHSQSDHISKASLANTLLCGFEQIFGFPLLNFK